MTLNRKILAAYVTAALTAATSSVAIAAGDSSRTSGDASRATSESVTRPAPDSGPLPNRPQSQMDNSTRSGTASEPSRTAGQVVDDASITAKVKMSLVGDEVTKARNINVDTRDGIVTLRGMVSSQQEAQRAIQIASATEGVRSVQSDLRIQ